MNSIQENLFQALDIYLNKKIPSSSITDIPSIVKKVNGKEIIVSIDGSEYIAKNGLNFDLKIGTPIWLHAMQGNMSQLYVISIR